MKHARKHTTVDNRAQGEALRLANRMLRRNPPRRCPRVDPTVDINRRAIDAITGTTPSLTSTTDTTFTDAKSTPLTLDNSNTLEPAIIVGTAQPREVGNSEIENEKTEEEVESHNGHKAKTPMQSNPTKLDSAAFLKPSRLDPCTKTKPNGISIRRQNSRVKCFGRGEDDFVPEDKLSTSLAASLSTEARFLLGRAGSAGVNAKQSILDAVAMPTAISPAIYPTGDQLPLNELVPGHVIEVSPHVDIQTPGVASGAPWYALCVSAVHEGDYIADLVQPLEERGADQALNDSILGGVVHGETMLPNSLGRVDGGRKRGRGRSRAKRRASSKQNTRQAVQTMESMTNSVRCMGVDVYWFEIKKKEKSKEPSSTEDNTPSLKPILNSISKSNQASDRTHEQRHGLVLSDHRDFVALESITRWGRGILRLDHTTGTYVVLNEEAELTSEDRAREQWDEQEAVRERIMSLLERNPDINAVPRDEMASVFATLFPTEIYDVLSRENGKPGILRRCIVSVRDDDEGCSCTVARAGTSRIITPLITLHGPVNLRSRIFWCKTHDKYFKTTHPDFINVCLKGREDLTMSHLCFKHGLFRFTDSVVLKMQVQSTEHMPVSQIRRDLALSWGSAALDKLSKMLSRQNLSTTAGPLLGLFFEHLSNFLPCGKIILDLMLLVYTHVVKPALKTYDAALAVYDGQVVRYDFTFGAARNVYCLDDSPTAAAAAAAAQGKSPNYPESVARVHAGIPSKTKGKKLSFQKISAAVLTICGREGMVMQAPKLVPSENQDEVRHAWTRNALYRREFLGANACPVATGSDNTHKNKHMIDDCVRSLFPELTRIFKDNLSDFHLQAEDLTHVYHRAERALAKREHPVDAQKFMRAMKQIVFRAAKCPHNLTLRSTAPVAVLVTPPGPAPAHGRPPGMSKAFDPTGTLGSVSTLMGSSHGLNSLVPTLDDGLDFGNNEAVRSLYEKICARKTPSKQTTLRNAARAFAENLPADAKSDRNNLMKELFAVILQKLGETGTRRLLDQCGFDDAGRAVPRYVVCDIASAVGLKPAALFPVLPYSSAKEWSDEVWGIFEWFLVPRERDDWAGIDIASRFAATFPSRFDARSAKIGHIAIQSDGGVTRRKLATKAKRAKGRGSSKGLTDTVLCRKTFKRLCDTTLSQYILNNGFIGKDDENGGTQQNEQFHAYLMQKGLSGGKGGKRSKEIQEMNLDYARLAYNDVKLHKWWVGRCVNGDSRHFAQVEVMRRTAAIILRGHLDSPSVYSSIYSGVANKKMQRATIGDLHALGFKTVATPGSVWTREEEEKVTAGMRAASVDPDVMGDYSSIEKWLSFVVLGGSRSTRDVVDKMNQMLRNRERSKASPAEKVN